MNDDFIGFTYNIPDDIISKIPDYFWPAIAGELCSVFGPDIFVKPECGMYGLFFISSTAGWNAALKVTCHKLDMMWLYEYYDKLQWWESDMFDGEIESLIVERFVEKDSANSNPYYLWIICEEE